MAKRADRRHRRAGGPDVDGGLLVEEGSKKAGAGRSRIISRLGVKRKLLTPADHPVPKKGSEPGNQGKGRSKSSRASVFELVVIVAIAVMLALGIQAFVLKPYKIPSGSMEPTLKVGQRVLANRIGMDVNGPYVGEIAVFHPPKDADSYQCGPSLRRALLKGGPACDETNPEENTSVNFIKRVVAGPGDEIYISEGHVYRRAVGKGSLVREHDPYIKECSDGYAVGCNFPTPIKIPPGHWFMMGDNRGESTDSRFWGPVPTGWFIGGAMVTYWPLDRVGFL